MAALRELYAGFQGVPIVETNAPTAEMIKYASNAMLATAISFSNEIANLGAEIGGIDVVEVMKGVHLSRYLTTPLGDGASVTAPLSSFLEAGCGYGGSCLPKDVAALAARGREVGSPMRLLEAVAEVNDRQPARLVELLRRRLGTLAARRVTVLGLAFKPDTDDVRSSPAFPVLRLLLDAGAEVSAHDPLVGPEALDGLGGRHLRGGPGRRGQAGRGGGDRHPLGPLPAGSRAGRPARPAAAGGRRAPHARPGLGARLRGDRAVRFTTTPVEGVTVVEVDRIVDDRGFFGRVWCRDEFGEQGLDADWVQANVGRSTRAGTLRGMHYQRDPTPR